MLTGNDLLTAVQNLPSRTERVKFTQVSRVICPKTGVHFLDAVCTNGVHYSAEMSPNIERWLVFTKPWSADRQQPYDL
jgi:hypothetical protein